MTDLWIVCICINMRSKLHIRFAKQEDLPLIFQMIKELAEYHGLLHKVKATKPSLRQSLFNDPKGADILIGEELGKPACMVIFYQIFSTFLGKEGIYIEDLYVRESYRGKGYGKRLLKEVSKIAKERKCGKVEWKVMKGNEWAAGFYKKMGAKPAPEWTTFKLTEKAFKELLQY